MQSNISNIKGGRDFDPKAMNARNRVIDILRKKFEGYGYLPLETASLNYLNLLTHKYDENAEIVHEIYKLRDQGDRELGLRYDLTVPFCKYIALNQNMKLPFKRYEIGKVWRNGPVKSGRAREFYQCDVDVVGIEGVHIEAELMALAVSAYREIGITPVIKYGNKKLLPYSDAVVAVIDKMAKISHAELVAELQKLMPEKNNAEIESFVSYVENAPKIPEIVELEKALCDLGIIEYCTYAPYLARGLNVYTGTVWEVFDKNGKIPSSLGAGGRYDRIIGDFIDNGVKYPAVGMSFGLEPILAVIEGVTTPARANIDLMLVPLGAEAFCHKYAETLRAKGQNVLVYLGGKSIAKAIEYASSYGIKKVAIVGENEVGGAPITIKEVN